MRNTLALAALAFCAVLAAASLPACAQAPLPPRDPPGAAELPPGATTSLPVFRGEALRSDALSLAASRLALKRARDPEVRALAGRVIQNRTATTDALLPPGTAQGDGLVPTGLTAGLDVSSGDSRVPGRVPLGPADRAALDRLRAAPGERFDRDYVAAQARSDRRMLALYDGFYRNGDTAQGRRFAYEALPYIETDRSRSAALDELYGG